VDIYWLDADGHAIPIIEGSSTDADEIIQAAKSNKFNHPLGAGDPPHFEHQ